MWSWNLTPTFSAPIWTHGWRQPIQISHCVTVCSTTIIPHDLISFPRQTLTVDWPPIIVVVELNFKNFVHRILIFIILQMAAVKMQNVTCHSASIISYRWNGACADRYIHISQWRANLKNLRKIPFDVVICVSLPLPTTEVDKNISNYYIATIWMKTHANLKLFSRSNCLVWMTNKIGCRRD